MLIALSGQCDASAKARADVSGFHHFIPKPYEPARLLAFLAELDKKTTS